MKGGGGVLFSRRTEWSLTPNAITRQLEQMRKRNLPVLDLTESNPTCCRLRYPKRLLSELASPESFVYEPNPKGLLSARKAVASLYAKRGISVDPERILLTASTSEAYSFLFKLLADPGDQILVPRPSYPLLDYLATLNDVEMVAYRLTYQNRWQIDWDSFLKGLSPKTRAVVVVHPNNPTGSRVTPGEFKELFSICRRHNLPLICDEVFADYLYGKGSEVPGASTLTFSLGGLSKSFGLPQMKLGWIVVDGPRSQVREAIERLEVIADTYLSVNTPVQLALPRWFALASSIQSQIRKRIQTNRRFLLEQLSSSLSSRDVPPFPRSFHPGKSRIAGQAGLSPDGPIQLLAADGGWNAVLRIPAILDEEAFVLDLLKKEQVLVHPGYFFDFEEPGFVVLSLLIPTNRFQEGLNRLLRWCQTPSHF